MTTDQLPEKDLFPPAPRAIQEAVAAAAAASASGDTDADAYSPPGWEHEEHG